MKKQKSKPINWFDLPLLIALPITGAIISWALPVNYLESMFLLLGPPVIYLSFRNKKAILRSTIFAISLSGAGLVMDYFGMRDKSWLTQTVFPSKVFGAVPIEDLVWFFLLVYLVVMFYEFFYDHLHHKLVSNKMRYLYLISLLGFGFMAAADLVLSHFYTINYFYLKSGILLGFLPVLAFVFEVPRFLSIFLKTMPYFLGLDFLAEVLGLHKGFWTFPGQHFIGWVNLGTLRFPWEELIFWMVLFSSSVIVYFEVFDDNRLKLKSRP